MEQREATANSSCSFFTTAVVLQTAGNPATSLELKPRFAQTYVGLTHCVGCKALQTLLSDLNPRLHHAWSCRSLNEEHLLRACCPDTDVKAEEEQSGGTQQARREAESNPQAPKLSAQDNEVVSQISFSSKTSHMRYESSLCKQSWFVGELRGGALMLQPSGWDPPATRTNGTVISTGQGQR